MGEFMLCKVVRREDGCPIGKPPRDRRKSAYFSREKCLEDGRPKPPKLNQQQRFGPLPRRASVCFTIRTRSRRRRRPPRYRLRRRNSPANGKTAAPIARAIRAMPAHNGAAWRPRAPAWGSIARPILVRIRPRANPTNPRSCPILRDHYPFRTGCWRRARSVAIKIDHEFSVASNRAGADELRDRAATQSRQSARANRGGGRARRQGHLSPGTVPLALLLPVRGGAQLRPRRADSRTEQRGPERGRRRAQGRRRRIALRASRRGHLPQHGGGDGRRRTPGRPLPQDAHSRRSALLREILFHPGRPRLHRASHRPCHGRRAGMLGPVVSRGGAAGRAGRRADRFLSRPRSDGSAAKSSRCAAASSRPGKRCSAATRSPTECSSRWSIGWAPRTAWSSGATRSWAIRSAR